MPVRVKCGPQVGREPRRYTWGAQLLALVREMPQGQTTRMHHLFPNQNPREKHAPVATYPLSGNFVIYHRKKKKAEQDARKAKDKEEKRIKAEQVSPRRAR